MSHTWEHRIRSQKQPQHKRIQGHPCWYPKIWYWQQVTRETGQNKGVVWRFLLCCSFIDCLIFTGYKNNKLGWYIFYNVIEVIHCVNYSGNGINLPSHYPERELSWAWKVFFKWKSSGNPCLKNWVWRQQFLMMFLWVNQGYSEARAAYLYAPSFLPES